MLNENAEFVRSVNALVTRVETGVATGELPRPLKRIYGPAWSDFVMFVEPEYAEPAPRGSAKETAATVLLIAAIAVALAVGVAMIAAAVADGLNSYAIALGVEAALLLGMALAAHIYVFRQEDGDGR